MYESGSPERDYIVRNHKMPRFVEKSGGMESRWADNGRSEYGYRDNKPRTPKFIENPPLRHIKSDSESGDDSVFRQPRSSISRPSKREERRDRESYGGNNRYDSDRNGLERRYGHRKGDAATRNSDMSDSGPEDFDFRMKRRENHYNRRGREREESENELEDKFRGSPSDAYYMKQAVEYKKWEKELVPEEEKEEVKPIGPPDYDNMNEEEKASYHADFRVRFGTLRTTFPELEIPDYGDNVDLKIKHKHLIRYMRHLITKDNIFNYGIGLAIGWGMIELGLVKFLGLPASGFFKRQRQMWKQYEPSIREMSESSGPIIVSEDWPPLIKLIVITLFNGMVFMAIKYMSRYAGGLGPLVEEFVNGLVSGSINIGGSDGNVEIGDSSQSGLPDLPKETGPNLGGLNLGNLNMDGIGSILQTVSGMMGGNSNNQKKPENPKKPGNPRRPLFKE